MMRLVGTRTEIARESEKEDRRLNGKGGRRLRKAARSNYLNIVIFKERKAERRGFMGRILLFELLIRLMCFKNLAFNSNTGRVSISE